jgi:hypothetical protein
MSDPHASASAPAEDEPKTPMWLPGLGAALFVSVGLWWAVTPGAPPPAAEVPSATASALAAPPATIAPRPQPVPVPPPSAAALVQAPVAPGVIPQRRPAPAGAPPGSPPPAQVVRKNPAP